MTSPQVVTVATSDSDPEHKTLLWVCPGCGDTHACQVAGSHTGRAMWGWDRSLTEPTLTPSVLKVAPGKRCHSFVKGGVVQFLGDCEHHLKGQSIRMLPENADPWAKWREAARDRIVKELEAMNATD